MAPSKRDAVDRVLVEVFAERERQHAKWGEQNHPDGTGPDSRVGSMHDTNYMQAELAKQRTNEAAKAGRLTYALILHEEVREAFAESDPAKLRAELVQVSAVAVAWVEKLDREAVNGKQ